MTPIRLYLEFNSTKIVYVIPSNLENGTISDLLDALTLKFISLRKLAVSNRLCVARVGGYDLEKSDRIFDVLERGDVLSLIDSETWTENFLSQNSYVSWHKLFSEDLISGNRRFVCFGKFEDLNQFYVSLGTNNKIQRVEVFDAEEIRNWSKNGKSVVLQQSDNNDVNLVSVYFNVENNRVVSVDLNLKTTSDMRPAVDRVFINEDLTQGEIVHVQRALDFPESFPEKLPNTERTGVDLQEPSVSGRDYASDPVRSEGQSAFELKQTGDAFLSIDSYRKRQQVSIEYLVTNNSNVDVSIIGIKAEYLVGDSWASAPVFSGHKDSPYYYSTRGAHDAVLRYGPRDATKIALTAFIPLENISQLLIDGRYLHGSLPEPLQVRFTLTDQDEKKTVIKASVESKLYDFKKEEQIKKDKPDLKKFFYCDDLETKERLYSFMTTYNGDYIMNTPYSSSSFHISPSNLREFVYEAIKNKAPEYLLDRSWESGSYSAQYYILTNIEKGYTYGLKVVLKTSTNTTIDYFPFTPNDHFDKS